MKGNKSSGGKENSNQREDQLQFLARTSLRFNQMETTAEVADFICHQVKNLVGGGCVGLTLLDESTQTFRIKALRGFEDAGLINSALHLTGTDPRKIQMAATEIPPDEMALYKSGRLELIEGGFYTLFARKYPKAVSTGIERLFNIRSVYSIGFVHKGKHIGGVAILTNSESLVETNRFIIENIVTQGAAIIGRIYSEEALHESEEKFHSLFNSISEGFELSEIILDDKGIQVDFKFVEVNPAFENLSGLSHEKLIGKTMKEINPDIESFWIETFGRVALTGHPVLFERRAPTTGKWLEVYAYSPQKGRFAALFRDITLRKKVEMELRESEEKFKNIFDNCLIGLSRTSIPGQIYVNKAFCDMLGYSEKELSNRTWQEVTHPDDIDLTQKALDTLVSGKKKTVRFVKRYIHKNGTAVWAEIMSSCGRDDNNKPLYLVTSIMDITESKLTEEPPETRQT